MDISELKRQQSENFNRHPWEITRARIARFLLKGESFDHIADIGSGDAYVIRELQKNKKGGIYSAVDTAYTPAIIELITLNEPSNIQFYNRPEYIEVENKAADLILLMDVLEHCKDDNNMLSSTTAAASLKAKFLITVPAFQCLFSEHDRLLGHFRRYTLKRLKNLCQKENLSVLHSGYFFFSLIPLRVLQRLSEKTGFKRTVHAADNWKFNKGITRFISAILWIDFRICYALSSVGIMLPGLSCYCICQKLPS